MPATKKRAFARFPSLPRLMHDAGTFMVIEAVNRLKCCLA